MYIFIVNIGYKLYLFYWGFFEIILYKYYLFKCLIMKCYSILWRLFYSE